MSHPQWDSPLLYTLFHPANPSFPHSLRYEIKFNTGGQGEHLDAPEKKKAAPTPKKGSEKNAAKVAVEHSSADKLRKLSSGSGSSKQRMSLKGKLKKASNAVSGADAFAKAGSNRNLRAKKRKSSKYGWIAKDMYLGPNCSMDRFEPKRVVGTGLMGTVQLAKFKKDDTWCALKMVKKDYVCRHDDARHIQAERKVR